MEWWSDGSGTQYPSTPTLSTPGGGYEVGGVAIVAGGAGHIGAAYVGAWLKRAPLS